MLKNIKMGSGDFLKIAPQEGIKDSFGRMRTSTPNTSFDTKFLYDKLPLLWDESIVGGTSIHNSGNACIDMGVSSSGQYVIRQTKYRFNYKPGKGQNYIFTGVLGSGVPNLIRRIGCFDENNGMFFELDGTILNTVIRKAGTDTRTSQDNWNILQLNGNDNTDINLDTSKTQIFAIDYQWLGTGSVRFGFNIDSDLHYVHKANHANSGNNVYTSTPNLPIRYEIISNGGSGSLKQICCTSMSEGGVDRWLTRSEGTNVAINANTIGTEYALLGLRLKDSNLSASITIDTVNLLALTNDSFKWSLYLNPVYSGTITYSNVSNSYLQIGRTSGGNPSAETVISGSVKLAEGYGSTQTRASNESLDNLYSLGATISGIKDELILTVTPFTSNLDIHGSLGWKEYL